MQKEEAHQAKLTRLKEDLARAVKLHEVQKKDLELVLPDKGVVEKQHDDLKIAMSKRARDDQKIKQLCADTENEAKKAKAELATHKTESAQWLTELNNLNLTMDRKLTESTFSPPSFIRFKCKWLSSYVLIPTYPNAGEFTRFRIQAFKAVKEARAKREKASGSTLPPKFDIIDHITALKARIAPLKRDHNDVMHACVHASCALFPECQDVHSTKGLIRNLNQT